jgi:hypothetical protein
MQNRLWPAAVVATCAFLVPCAAQAAQKQHSSLPSPHLVFRGTEAYEANGFDFIRYQYEVTNKAKYPKALFTASPDLPPCGESTSPSRTTVEIHEAAGKRMIEFCSLPGPENLDRLWFAVEKGTAPPDSVYVEITDRLTGSKSRSNMAPTGKPDHTKH